MLRQRLIVLFTLHSVAVSLGAQAVLRSHQFTPSTFFVGDEVTLLIEFDVSEPMAVEIPSFFPESEWIEIRSIDIQEWEGTLAVLIAFSPYAPGTRTLPPMELGALKLVDIKIPTYSILQNTHDDVRTLRGQMMLPGTKLAVALILTVLAMAPFLGYGLFRFVLNQVKQLQLRFRFNQPVRKMHRLVKKLHTRIGVISAPLWYSELTKGIRDYLSSHIHQDCRSATTVEIALMEEFQNDDSLHQTLLMVLQDGDMVKFAGRRANDQVMENTLFNVERVIRGWEKSHA